MPSARSATTTLRTTPSSSAVSSTGRQAPVTPSSTCFTTRCFTSSIRSACAGSGAASTPLSSRPKNRASRNWLKPWRLSGGCSRRVGLAASPGTLTFNALRRGPAPIVRCPFVSFSRSKHAVSDPKPERVPSQEPTAHEWSSVTVELRPPASSEKMPARP